MAIRDALLNAKSLARETVQVSDVGPVVVQALKAGEFLALRESCLIKGKKGKYTFNSGQFQTLLIARCVVDAESGARVFSDGDVEAIGNMPSGVVTKLAEAASRLCGITQDDEDELGEASAPVAGPISSV